MSLVFHTNRVHFGRGILGAALRTEIERRHLRRLAIFADRVAIGYGQLERLTQHLPSDIDVLLLSDEDASDLSPTIPEICDLIALEDCDAVVAIGHERIINRAKAVARDSLVTKLQHASSIGADSGHMPYLIAVPVDASAISALGPTLTLPTDAGGVSCLIDSDLAPDAAICDPDVASETSLTRAAAVGMHIVADCVEAYLARGENPLAEILALNGVQRSIAFLELVTAGRSVLQGSELLMSAAIEAMLAASKGMGAARAMCNAVSGLVDDAIEPGQISAVVLPVVLDFNTTADRTWPRLAEVLHLPEGVSLASYFRRLAQRLALPPSLAALGVDRQMLPHLARLAFRDHNTMTNPSVVTERDYAAMLALAGGFPAHGTFN